MNNYMRWGAHGPYWTWITPSDLLVLSSNAFSLLSCKKMCFEAYKGPRHWLNHLFKTHHLQGLMAMLTSFSYAPGMSGSVGSIIAVRATEAGQCSPPISATGPSRPNTSLHMPHWCSCSLFPSAPQSCDCSLMLALGKKEGLAECALCLEAANTKSLATQMWDYRTGMCGCMSGEHKNRARKRESYNEREREIERQNERDKAHWSHRYYI